MDQRFDHLIFNAEAFEAEEAIAALREHNCIQLKNAINTQMIRAEREVVLPLKAKVDKPLPSTELTLFYRLGQNPFDIALPFVNVLTQTPLFDIASGYLVSNEICLPAFYYSQLRHVKRPAETAGPAQTQPDILPPYPGGLPYHQDGAALDPIVHGEVLIIWFLISPEQIGDGHAPDLRVLPGTGKDILSNRETKKSAYVHDLEMPGKAIQEMRNIGGEWVPRLELGDAFIFNGYCPHATRVTSAMSQDRFSCELKMFANNERFTSQALNLHARSTDHFIVNRNYAVGPVCVQNFAGERADRSIGKNETDRLLDTDFTYRYGRVRNEHSYIVERPSDSSQNKPQLTVPDEIIFLDSRELSIWPVLQCLNPNLAWNSIAAENNIMLPLRGPKASVIDFDDIVLTGADTPHRSFACILDNPVERVISAYVQAGGQANDTDFQEHVSSSGDLSYFANQFGTLLNSLDPLFDGTATENIIEALQHYMDKGRLTLLMTDRFEESLFLMCSRFGWTDVGLPRFFSPLEAPGNGWRPNAPSMELLEDKLHLDLSIVTIAQNWLTAQIKVIDFGPALEHYKTDFTRFKRALSQIDGIRLAQQTYQNIIHSSRWLCRNGADANRVLDSCSASDEFRQAFSTVLSTESSQENIELEAHIRKLEHLIEFQNQKIERMQDSYTTLLRQKNN